jgi:hypothetical protein
MQMYSEFKNEAWLCRVSAVYYGCICPWKEHVQAIFEPLNHAYHVGMGTGDFEYAIVSLVPNLADSECRDVLLTLFCVSFAPV